MIRPTRVEVDLGAVAANARVLAGVGGGRTLAVVKADAYGHGAVPVARALAERGGVDGFAVSLVEEGVELRDAGIAQPILVMGPSLAGGEEAVLEHRLSPMVSSLPSLQSLVRAARRQPGRSQGAGRGPAPSIGVHLKIDSGMGRLGLARGELASALEILAAAPGLVLAGVATHFACADTDDPADEACMTYAQLRRFGDWVRAAGIPSTCLRHAANSAGALRFEGARLDAIRPGLALYAAGAASGDARFASTTRFVSAITQLRAAEAGSTVSYGALWTASRPSRLAVVPVGYADGLPRALTGRAHALVRGTRVPVAGVISMDITVLDVTDVPDVSVGDEVVLLGRQGAEEITIPEFASRARLSEYEVTCGISKRVPRNYQ